MNIQINERLTLFLEGGQAVSTDAYLLSAYAKKTKLCAELGCGTGVCSLLLADHKKADRIVAYELQDELARAAAENVQKNELGEIIFVKQADIRTLAREERFDTVVANPPYLKVSGKTSPDAAKAVARQEFFGGVADFCACASRLLTDGGRFYCVYRPDRLSELFAALKENRFEPKLMTLVHHTLTAEASMVLIEAKKGASPSMRVTRPLILRKDNGEMTDDAQKIYDNCTFKDFLYE